MYETLLYDDNDSFVSSVKECIANAGIASALVTSSFREARNVISGNQGLRRVIADLVIDDREETGVDLLTYARKKIPGVSCVLLTGRLVHEKYREALDRIQGVAVQKLNLTRELLCDCLLRAEIPVPSDADRIEENMDVGELILKYQQVAELNDLLIGDMIEEMGAIEAKEKRALVIGEEKYSVVELEEEIRNKTALGRKLIALHRTLNREMRDR